MIVAALPCPPQHQGPSQLLLRTDPVGAGCSVVRDGIIVASIDATPLASHLDQIEGLPARIRIVPA